MNAVILAAGYGSRMSSVQAPKPLVEVAGLSLLEWSVRQMGTVGITHAVIVTGHCADIIETRMPAIAQRTGVDLEPCRLIDWSRPNGHSVIAGAARTRGNYLLVMADHLFSATLLRRLIAEYDRRCGAALAIDRGISGPAIDADDATWVRCKANGHIAKIGKHLPSFDAVDCGAFIATPDLAEAIAEVIEEGAQGSLSEGMQRLADRGMAGTVDVTGEVWIDVDTPEMRALAETMAPKFNMPDLGMGVSDRVAA
ncbi:NTP transferase domain-containing protein [Kamptonema cortianum]|nr:NTP transferase domain-containing protein [Kamptonema cortianum]